MCLPNCIMTVYAAAWLTTVLLNVDVISVMTAENDVVCDIMDDDGSMTSSPTRRHDGEERH